MATTGFDVVDGAAPGKGRAYPASGYAQRPYVFVPESSCDTDCLPGHALINAEYARGTDRLSDAGPPCMSRLWGGRKPDRDPAGL